MDMVVKRFQVWLINLDPTVGQEIKKVRPCVVISPDELNKYLGTIIAVPMTSSNRPYPTRINCTFKRKKGQIALDQIRTLDKERLIQNLGSLEKETSRKVCNSLKELFEY